jgi:two-component system NtrC family sensor kinase
MTEQARVIRARTRRRKERLRALHAIARRLAVQRLEPRARGALLVQHLAPVIPFERLSIAIFDPHKDLLHFVYAAGTGSEILPPSQPRGDDALSYALNTRHTLRLGGSSSELHSPLHGRGRALGVISLYSDQPNVYNAEDEQFMELVAAQLAAAWTETALARQSRRRLNELHILHDATVAMTAGLSLDQALETLGVHLLAAIGTQGVRVLGVDGPAEFNVLLDICGAPGLTCLPAGRRVARSTHPIAERAIATRRTIGAPAGAIGTDNARRPAEPGVRAVLAMPLIVQNEVVGVVVLRESRWDRGFTVEDLRIGQMLVTHAALAIENARIYRQATQLVAELAALRETALELAEQLDFTTLLERVIERASHLLGARGGALYLLEPDGVTLRLAISRVPWADYTGRRLRLGEGLAGRVAADGRAMALDNYRTWEGRAAQYEGEPIMAVASVPLRWSDQVIGVLSLLDDRPGHVFSRGDVALLEQFAPQAGLSIRNMQLYRDLQHHVAELERTQAQLVQSEKLAALGRITGSIAHEVNNPLQSIQNCLHLAMRDTISEQKRQEYLRLADVEVTRLVNLLSHLLDFYGPLPEERTPTDINAVLRDVLALARPQLERAGVRSQCNLDPQLPAADSVPGHLKQVFLNLILNAIEAMPTGGVLRVTTRTAGQGSITIDFADTGRGIAPEDLPMIFEPFFTSKERGAGLGLAVSYGIVQAHAGGIEVNSVPGEGTTFSVRLPVKEQST